MKTNDCPPLLRQFLNYMLVIRNRSKKTVDALYIDLRVFLRFLKMERGLAEKTNNPDTIRIGDLPAEVICSATRSDVYEFLYYLADVRGNSPVTRSRKLSSVKDFYKYLLSQGKVEDDPTALVEAPSMRGQKTHLPIYLQQDQCLQLLDAVNGEFPERDRCIIMLFISCGMRLSELTGINLSAITTNTTTTTIKLHGKGNKERLAYLNDSCAKSLHEYLEIRKTLNLIDEDALFVSKRTGKRLKNGGVERMLKKQLARAGLTTTGCTPHKLRHTAATLMYQTGVADLHTLQLILGHASPTTTEIYTHAGEDQIAEAMRGSQKIFSSD